MKLLVVCALVALIAARPQNVEEENIQVFEEENTQVFEAEKPQYKSLEDAGILRMDMSQSDDGSFQYGFETTDPIQQDVAGQIKQIGEEFGVVMQGSYSYIAQDENGNDVPINVSWIADENGFQPVGDVIPQDATSQAQTAVFDEAEIQDDQGEFE